MENRNRFKYKHIIVTGGARGIGLEIVKQFVSELGMVTILDSHQDNLNEVIHAFSKTDAAVNGILTDVSDRKNVEAAIAEAEKLAPIDILINNAGIAQEKSFLLIDPEEWCKILDINLTGMFHVSQVVCRKMAERGKGVVVNMASKNGMDGEAGYAHYNASKGGVIMLTKTMALELATSRIRVNAVCPGYIQTPMSMEIDSPEFTNNFVNRYIPLNRAGQVDEVAPMFLFLASDESSFITGQTFVIDGGQLAGQKIN